MPSMEEGLGRYHQGPMGLFQVWHVSREAWNGPPQQEVDGSMRGLERSSCPDPPGRLFSSGCYFFGWPWTFSGYFSSCHLRYIQKKRNFFFFYS